MPKVNDRTYRRAGELAIFVFLAASAPCSAGNEPTTSNLSEFNTTAAMVLPLTPQHNIRSGRHVDLAAAPDGGVYLASFKRSMHHQPMRLLIERRLANGQLVWSHAPELAGRATSLALTPGGKLWVTGWVSGRFNWETASTAETPEPRSTVRAFLISLDSEGNVQQSVWGPDCLQPMFVRCHSDGCLLLVGQVSATCAWEGKRLQLTTGTPGEGGQFIALLDATGQLRQLESLAGNAIVNQVRATRQGFVLAGAFKGEFRIGKQMARTTGPLDADAFLLSLDQNGNPRWLATAGEPEQVGHAVSREGIYDFVSTDDGSLITIGLQSPPVDANNKQSVRGRGHEHPTLSWWSPDGKLQKQVSESVLIGSPASLVLTRSGTGQLYTVGLYQQMSPAFASGAATKLSELILRELEPNARPVRRQASLVSVNTMARGLLINAGQLFIAGHFQEPLTWGGHSVSNTGFHQLFLICQPLTGDARAIP